MANNCLRSLRSIYLTYISFILSHCYVVLACVNIILGFRFSYHLRMRCFISVSCCLIYYSMQIRNVLLNYYDKYDVIIKNIPNVLSIHMRVYLCLMCVSPKQSEEWIAFIAKLAFHNDTHTHISVISLNILLTICENNTQNWNSEHGIEKA